MKSEKQRLHLKKLAELGGGMKGKHHSEKSKQKMSRSMKGRFTEEESPHWKREENLSFSRKHVRIERKYGKPKYCEHCKRTDQKKYDWANKDHKHKLDISNWMRLCRSCHKKYDMKYNGHPNPFLVKKCVHSKNIA